MPNLLVDQAKKLSNKALLVLLALSTVTVNQTFFDQNLPCSAAQPAGKKVDKYILKLDFNGSANLLVAADGAVWRVPSLSSAYYCMAPKWDILIFNEKTKIGRIYPYAFWINRINGKDPIKVKTKTAIPTYCLGRPARTLYLEIEPMDSLKSKGEFFYQSSDRKATDYNRMEIVELQQKNIPPKILEFLRWRSSMPFLNGPLLKSTNVYKNGKRETTVSVVSLTPTTVPFSEWLPPTKYKLVKSSALINDDRNKFNKAAELFDTLMP